MKNCPRCGASCNETDEECPVCHFRFNFISQYQNNPSVGTANQVPMMDENESDNSLPTSHISDHEPIENMESFKDWFKDSLLHPMRVVNAPFQYGLWAYMIHLAILLVATLTITGKIVAMATAFGLGAVLASGIISMITFLVVLGGSIFGLLMAKLGRIIGYRDSRDYSMLTQYMHYFNISNIVWVVLIVLFQIPGWASGLLYTIGLVNTLGTVAAILTLTNLYNSTGERKMDGIFTYLRYLVINGVLAGLVLVGLIVGGGASLGHIFSNPISTPDTSSNFDQNSSSSDNTFNY